MFSSKTNKKLSWRYFKIIFKLLPIYDDHLMVHSNSLFILKPWKCSFQNILEKKVVQESFDSHWFSAFCELFYHFSLLLFSLNVGQTACLKVSFHSETLGFSNKKYRSLSGHLKYHTATPFPPGKLCFSWTCLEIFNIL